MSGHTKGPWMVYEKTDAWPGIEASDGRGTIIIFGRDEEECGVRGETRKQILANARLIAAAPDMLSALQKIVAGPLTIAAPPDVVSAVQDYHELVCEIARAAINKAEGR